jgi:hypothetical protein
MSTRAMGKRIFENRTFATIRLRRFGMQFDSIYKTHLRLRLTSNGVKATNRLFRNSRDDRSAVVLLIVHQNFRAIA